MTPSARLLAHDRSSARATCAAAEQEERMNTTTERVNALEAV